jgi:glycosyltransferase involved in cell wall biosynthesis
MNQAPTQNLSTTAALSAPADELDLTIFVACRNEQGNIGRTLNEVKRSLEIYPYSYEIIVADDASRDGSIAEIEDFIRRNPGVNITLKRNTRPRGVNHNLCDAAMLGRGRYFQFISGAFQNRIETQRAVFDMLGSADLVLTYLSPDLRVWHRRELSRLYTRLVNFVSGYNVRHYHGTPLFRRSDVLRWHSYHSVGFFTDMITRMFDEGITYIQIPTTCHEREVGKSRALRLRNVVSLFLGFVDMLLRRVSKERIPSVELPVPKVERRQVGMSERASAT